MAHGSADDIARAKAVLDGANPLMLDTHPVSPIGCPVEIATTPPTEKRQIPA